MNNLNNLEFDVYQELKENLIENLFESFDQCRTMTTVEVADGFVEIQLNHLLINLILLRPYVEFKEKITKNSFIDCTDMNTGKFNKRLQEIIDIFQDKTDMKSLSECISSIIEDTNYLTMKFNPLIGLSIDVYSIAKLASRNQEFDDLIHTTLDYNNMSQNEIGEYRDSQYKRFKEVIAEPENQICFSPYLRYGEGLNEKQLQQYAINIGPKPTLDGSIYPIPVNTNLLMGFKEASDYYIDATGGRKASIINSDEVRESGYMARRLTLATINTYLNTELDDCKSPNHVLIDLRNLDDKRFNDTMKRLNGRYVIFNGKEERINENNIEKYREHVLKLKSPVTCASKQGICKKCYGHLADLNFDIHIGKLGVDILSSQLTQTLLSSKHLLDTKSEKIDWNSNLLKVFKINSNTLLPAREFTPDNNITLLIDREDIDLEDYIYNNRNDNSVFITKLSIKYKDKVVKVELPKKLYPSVEVLEYLKKCKTDEEKENYIIEMCELPEDQTMFYFTIENNELSSHLYRLLELIERKDHLGCVTFNEMINMICDILAKSGLRIDLVHIENLVRELVKDSNTKNRPNFAKPVTDDSYDIYTLDNSILNNNSLVVGLAFEKLAKQFLDPATYEKTEPSFLNSIFK